MTPEPSEVEVGLAQRFAADNPSLEFDDDAIQNLAEAFAAFRTHVEAGFVDDYEPQGDLGTVMKPEELK